MIQIWIWVPYIFMVKGWLSDKYSKDLIKKICHKNTHYMYLLDSIERRILPDFPDLVIYFMIYHHHHHVVPLARISVTLSRHFSLSFIASGRSSGLHPVSSHSCWMYVRADRPAYARPYVGVHRSILWYIISLFKS